MKTTVSLLLLSAGLAYAQRPDYAPQSAYRNRIEGTYESDVLGGRIRRTLRIERDGRVEIVTEIGRLGRGNGYGRDRDDREWNGRDDRDGPGVQSRMYLGRYGRTAVEAARGRTVRHTGRWTQRNDRIVLRMDDLRFTNGNGGWNNGNERGGASSRGQRDDWRDDRSDLRLTRRGDGFVLSGDYELYGREDAFFRRDLDRNNDWPRGGDRLGTLRYDDERLLIDRINLIQRSGDDRLTISAGRRTLEFRGDARREGDRVVFRVRNDNQDRGTFTLTMLGDRVVAIRGTGEDNGRRVSFDESYDRRDVDRRGPWN